MLPRLRVLRHEENVALSLASDFVHKFREACRVCKIDVCVRLYAVSVTAADQHHVPALRQTPRFAILFPVPKSIEFQSMNPCSELLEKLIHHEPMSLLPDQEEVPHGMVEDDQDVRLFMKSNQDFFEAIAVRFRRELRESVHPLLRSRAWQIVNADVEVLHTSVGNTPLYRDRNLPRAWHGTKQHGRFDRIVIGDRHHRVEAEPFDLALL